MVVDKIPDLNDLPQKLLYFSPWMELDAYDWKELTKGQLTKSYKRNSTIFYIQEVNTHIYIVKKGRIRISTFSEEGDEQSIAIARPGCMIGELSVIDGKPNMSSAIAITDAELYIIPKEHLETKLPSSLELQTTFMKNLAEKIRLLYSQVQNLSFRGATSRIAICLLMLSKDFGVDTHYGCKLSIKFTHQEMANLTGLCRVTVSNIMSELINRDIIGKIDNYVVIKNFNELVNMVL